MCFPIPGEEADRHESAHDPTLAPGVTEQTADGQRLTAMHEDVGQAQVDEEKASALALHVVAHPQRVWRDHLVLGEDPMYMRGIEDGAEILRVQILHDGNGALLDGIPIGVERLHIDPGAEIEHLIGSHAGAEVAAGHSESSAPPAAIENLLAIADKAVKADVFHPRHMPYEPGEGIDARAGRSAHLL